MMITNIKFLKTLLLLLLLQIPFAYAADQKPVTQLKNFLTTTKTLTANFKQVVFDEAGQAKQTSYGVFNLSRPGKFRWNYQKPFLQEIVSNNGKVWFYDADLEQVTIKKLDKSMGSTPALLLTGDVDIEKEFNIEKQGDDDGMQWIKLLPKNPESNFKYVLIGLNEGVLGGMELSDNFGQLTRIYFSEVALNPQIRAEEFVFNVPKGVDVLEDKVEDKPKHKHQEKLPDTELVKEQTPAPLAEPLEEQVDEQLSVEDEDVTPAKHTSRTKSGIKHKDSSNAKSKDKEPAAKTKDKSKDKTADKAKDKSKDKTADKAKDKKDKSTDKTKNKSKEKTSDKAKDKSKPASKSKDKPASKSKDKHK